MKWCSNYCHPQLKWCGRKNCMNKAEFAKKMQESQQKEAKNQSGSERKSESVSDGKPSNEFKIALAAMCSEEDYQFLEKQFFSGN